MADYEEYDELDAVVRIPKGGRLADSRKTEGWSRGFIAKSTDKGPEHVEIRLKDGNDSRSIHDPEIVYVTEYVKPGRRRDLTPAQQATADFMVQILDGLFEVAKPVVAEWWDTRVIPAMATKRDEFIQKRRSRRAEKKAMRAVMDAAPASQTTEDDTSSHEAVIADGLSITMTSEQFQQLFMLWLAREDAQQSLWHAIANADVRDDDAAPLAWRQRLNELSPEQRTARVREILSANPSILEDLGRHLMDGGPVELGKTIRRPDGL